MQCEVVAVGTELLLGQVVDTNSAWLGERLAEAGIDCCFQTRVGDNVGRIVAVLRAALARSEAVIVCGGLGPTPDDTTREAIAEIMGVPLERDESLAARIRAMFAEHGREMAGSNLRQADVPRGASVIPQAVGTAPGLVCPLGERVLYAVPGVPAEMREMVDRAVIDNLRSRAITAGTIASRSIRVWGLAEAVVAERLAHRLAALDQAGGALTMAFLASPAQGVTVRLTAKAADHGAAHSLLDAEEGEVRSALGQAVFGVDGDSMESVLGASLEDKGLSLGLAESLTGGLVASRLVGVEGASMWLRGSVVAYDSEVKHELLGVRRGPVVTEEAARAMAEGARQALGADVGLALTGVAGPESQEGMPPGTVFVGTCLDGSAEVARLHLSGGRSQIRQQAATWALDLLRRRLDARGRPS